MNFVTQEFVNRLQLTEKNLEISIAGVMQGIVHATKVVNLCIKSRFNNFQENIECVVLPKITQHLPQQSVSIQDLTIPKNIKLADPNFHISAGIDMLIGAEVFWRVICAGQIKNSRSHPIIQKTHFGWVISGSMSNVIARPRSIVNFHASEFDELNQSLKRFWEVEHISNPQYSKEEQACNELFLEGVNRSVEGRYIVRLPVKPNILNKLGESRETAMRRFKKLEARLITQPSDLYEEYKRFMAEYQALGHMREISDEQVARTSGPSFYLPHHAVRNETSLTTRVRVVFDGSCKSSTGISLNDALMIGPTQQEDLFSIMTRFRTFKIAITADITKMYRQVLIDPNQTALQRIIWRSSNSLPLTTFELMTVTYGTSSASFLAIRTIRRLAEDYSTQYPLASKVLLRDFYVDDLISGADTVEEASQLKNELTQLLYEGKFELRKWSSNEPSLRDEYSGNSIREFNLATDKNTETRALGLIWNCSSDSFKVASVGHLPPLQKLTKRRILSRAALTFDPLGLIGPVTVVAKIMIQDLWRLNTGWDESVPLACYTKWKQYERELSILRDINISRLVVSSEQHTSLEIHGFSDASENAYGACIYLRSTLADGRHITKLLCSKSRVAPLKSISLPRLELCAALLLAQLLKKVTDSLPCQIDEFGCGQTPPLFYLGFNPAADHGRRLFQIV
ncbi:PREDICTED: uncharacterized protein LOC108776927 [Cyphomyrmex costatus]|uniref:uncharacterized protein LOC108776927 n=1 Tax=Cyphomyrmex costatus TaxID=456900 RepID=UPI00085224DF|nr:PREDICTED: uncharacterized protein LOC108776927 [Cyphomyrmex costatus]